MFCARHLVPHEDCPDCQGTVSAMRPTIFAELAAAELRSGTECCRGCDYIFYEAVACCPRCGSPNPLTVAADTDFAPAIERIVLDLPESSPTTQVSGKH